MVLALWHDNELAAGWMAVLASWRNGKLVAGLLMVLARWRNDELAAGRKAVLAGWRDDKSAAGRTTFRCWCVHACPTTSRRRGGRWCPGIVSHLLLAGATRSRWQGGPQGSLAGMAMSERWGE
jgi:hypothetical protein